MVKFSADLPLLDLNKSSDIEPTRKKLISRSARDAKPQTSSQSPRKKLSTTQGKLDFFNKSRNLFEVIFGEGNAKAIRRPRWPHDTRTQEELVARLVKQHVEIEKLKNLKLPPRQLYRQYLQSKLPHPISPRTQEARRAKQADHSFVDTYTELKSQEFKPSSSLSGARGKDRINTSLPSCIGTMSSTNQKINKLEKLGRQNFPLIPDSINQGVEDIRSQEPIQVPRYIGKHAQLQFGQGLKTTKRNQASTSQGFHNKVAHKSLSQAYRLISMKNKANSLTDSVVQGTSANFNKKWGQFPLSLDQLEPFIGLQDKENPKMRAGKMSHEQSNYFNHHLRKFLEQNFQRKRKIRQDQITEINEPDSRDEVLMSESPEDCGEQDENEGIVPKAPKNSRILNLEAIFTKSQKKKLNPQEKRPRISAKIGDEKAGKKFELFFQEVEINPFRYQKI